MRARYYLALAAFAVAMFTGGQLLKRALGDSGARAALLDQVLAHVQKDYVDSLDIADLYRKAATGLVAELHDPYSVVLDERRLKSLQESTAGEYNGVGVQVDVRDGWLSVIAPLAGSPAERGGLRPGDRIVEIDGRAVSSRSPDEARGGLRGVPGTKVTLLVERPGADGRIPIVITRAAIHLNAVRHALMLAPGVGYVQLAIFSESSSVQLKRAVSRLRNNGALTLLLDLRGDPGGLLEQGVGVSDAFLDPKQTVVSLRSRVQSENVTITRPGGTGVARTHHGDPRGRGHGERVGDRCRGAAGSRPRAGARLHHVRQGERAVHLLVGRGARGAAPDDGALVHAEWPQHPAAAPLA